ELGIETGKTTKVLEGARCVARTQERNRLGEVILESPRRPGIWRNEGVPYALDHLLRRRIRKQRLLDEIVHDARGKHWRKIFQMHEIENALHLLGTVDRSTAGIGREVLERNRTIVDVFAQEFARFHGKELMRVPSFGCDRRIRVSRHVV